MQIHSFPRRPVDDARQRFNARNRCKNARNAPTRVGENSFCGFDRGTLTQFSRIQNRRAFPQIESECDVRIRGCCGRLFAPTSLPQPHRGFFDLHFFRVVLAQRNSHELAIAMRARRCWQSQVRRVSFVPISFVRSIAFAAGDDGHAVDRDRQKFDFGAEYPLARSDTYLPHHHRKRRQAVAEFPT